MKAAVGTRAKIEAFVRTRLAYLDQHRDFFAVYHSEFGNLTHPATLNSEFRRMYRRQFELLEKVIEQDTFDESAIRSASAEVAAVETDTTVQRARIRSEALQILTPDQRAQLGAHLDALLAQGGIASPLPEDASLLSAVRLSFTRPVNSRSVWAKMRVLLRVM